MSRSKDIRTVSASREAVSLDVVRLVDDTNSTVLGHMSFDRIYGDLHVTWTVDGRSLSLADKVSHILWFVRFIARL